MIWLLIFLQLCLFNYCHAQDEVVGYGFLDLYKFWLQNDLTNRLLFENPPFLGSECGPGAMIALDKANSVFNKTVNGDILKLELVTSHNLTKTKWDIDTSRRGQANWTIECGDEWSTARCLNRMIEQISPPSLIIGSHKDISFKLSAIHSYIYTNYSHNSMFVHTSAATSVDNVVPGREKIIRGFQNTIRLEPNNDELATMIDRFVQTFSWTERMLLIHEDYEAQYVATSLYKYKLSGKLCRIKSLTGIYPFEYPETVTGKPDEENVVFKKDLMRNFTDEYFKGVQIKHHYRVVLLFGSQKMVRDMMLQAYDADMTQSNEYVFIIIPTNYYPLYTWEAEDDDLFLNMTQKDRDEDARKAFQSAFIVTAEINTTLFDSFSKKVKERAKQAPFDYEFPATRNVPLYAANYHDAVLLWAYAMKHHFHNENKSIDVSKLYDKTFTKEQFMGIEPVTGNIELNKHGDRKNSFIFWHLNSTGTGWEKVGRYADQQYSIIAPESEIAWPGGKKSAPPAIPVCGFQGELCPDYRTRNIGIGVGVGAAVVLIVGFLFMTNMYRKAKYEAELASMSWKIQLSEIKSVNNNHLGSSVFGTRSRLTMGSQCSNTSNTLKNMQYFSKRARYQNKIVALKTILPQYMAINRGLMVELKTLKELRNENILSIHGAVIDQDICYLVMEYCNKGSLQDILENDEIKLDDTFKFSLINDLVKGMIFLHSSVIETHGYLKSSNCIINNHFSLKISDISRTIFMSDMERINRMTAEARNQRLVYRAPELLRMKCVPLQGTKEADMYSFGIVIHEILMREGPYGLSNMDCDLTATEVINLITKTDNITPYRPELPFTTDAKLSKAFSMARDAWNENPIQRPTFTGLRPVLKFLKPDTNSGLVENLLGRMEKYATNLEEVVEERTAQLQVEKKRTDDLLESMLPKSVADQLKSGHPPPPEWFDCVSIYFSDIVGFTKLSSKSTPMQVLDMLNDLYTVFDECIEKYDCYKVETIGDAYMVVSGLPIRNGDRHAAQIGLMSLDFLTCIKNFEIRHCPEEQIRIRIGMHSGPVVAGIVGIKMPRYCLFGDTVNTASRMESNGEALKIQMSEQSYDILHNHGGFIIQSRGLVEMKGKGKVPTYWLNGVENDLNFSNPRNFTDQQLLVKLNNAMQAQPPNYIDYNNNINHEHKPQKIPFPKLNNVKHDNYKTPAVV